MRFVLTTSPYSMIRRVEDQYELKPEDNLFKGNDITYKGKIWHKEIIGQ